MNASYTKAETLTSVALAPLDFVRSAALVVGFSLLTALSAQVVIPLPWTPVPITGQTFAVLLTGALLGPRLGALAMIAYLIEGASGLPFFAAGGSGVQRLLDRKSTRLNSSHTVISYAVFCLKKKTHR